MMMLRTTKGVRQLRKGSGDAIARIVKLADDTALDKPKPDLFAWGQFLDGPRNVEQYGLFGTAAAVSILVKGGYSQHHAKVDQSRHWLPEIEPTTSTPTVLDQTDMGLIFKLAAVLSVAEQDAAGDYVHEEQIETRLLDALVEGKGWGNFHYATVADTTPRVLPTVHALLALRPSRTFRSSKTCPEVLEWLSSTVVQRTNLRPHELAMAGIALQAYAGQGVEVAQYDEALSTITRRLTRWVRTDKRPRDDEVNSYHYMAPTGPRNAQHTHYMFYLPHVLAARYFLQLKQVPSEVKTYVLEVVRHTVSNVKDNNGFKSAGSEQVATLDQLEVYQLLRVFHERAAQPTDLLPAPVRIVSESRTRRIITSGVLVVVALATAMIAASQDHSTLARAAGAVVSALATGMLPAFWYSWSGGE